MKSVFVLILLALFHTLPYWDTSQNLVGTPGDPFAHAAIGEWYCKNVVPLDFHFDGYMAPFGVNVSGNYDSPFPFILTCPILAIGPQAQFHLFSFFQILLILLSAWAASGVILRNYGLRWAYVLLTWFCGFYIVRSHVHLTLLSVIWGFQLSLFALLTYNRESRKSVILSFFLISLSLCGTFQNLTALFLFNLVFLFIILKDLRFYTNKQRVNLLIGLGFAASVFLVLWGPMLLFTLNNIGPVFNSADLRAQNSLTWVGLAVPFGSHFVSQFIGASVVSYEQANAMDWLVALLFFGFILFKRFKLTLLEQVAVGIGLFYLYLSFGPTLPINDWVFEFYPFKIGRTPSRFAVVTHLILIALTLKWLEDAVRSEKLKSKLGLGLSIWAIAWGPAANAMWFAPTFKYKGILPEKGLSEIKSTATEKSIVAMVPSAWAAEPIYNFLRLFHGQKITSAYLAFPVYNVDMVKSFAEDPFLSEIDCGRTAIAYKGGELLNNSDGLRNYLKEKNIEFVIINKNHLSSIGGCEELKSWVFRYLKFPWVKVLEENNNFLVIRNL